MSRVSKSAVLALATAFCAVIIAVPAQAKTEQIKSGQTSVKLSPLVTALLAKTGLTVTAVGPAKVGRRLAVDADVERTDVGPEHERQDEEQGRTALPVRHAGRW